MKLVRRNVASICVVALLALIGCRQARDAGLDTELTTLGTAEVTAQLIEIPGEFPPNDLYDYVYVFKYRVLRVHRGDVPAGEILVGQYNPLKPRSSVQDERSGKMGGRVERFHAGDIHRMALASPLDQQWMGGVIDKYFEQKGVRYWAIWTNPGEK